MMWRPALLAIALAGVGLSASAQTTEGPVVAVQAGEHPGFTRLALNIGSATEWEFGRTEEGYALLAPGLGGFSIGRVFNVVPRDRLADLRSAAGRLDLVIDCDCRANVFRHEGAWLIVDIRNGAPDPASPLEQPLSLAAVPAAGDEVVPGSPAVPPAAAVPGAILPLFTDAAPVPVQILPGGPSLTPPAMSAVAPSLPRTASVPAPADLPVAADPVQADAGAAGARAPDENAAAVLTRQMAESLIRAADQGLLDLAMPASALTAAAGLEPVTPRESLSPRLPEPVPPSFDRPGIMALSSMDRDLAELLQGAVAQSGACLPETAFDLAAWAGSGDFVAEIGFRRAAVVDARFTLDESAIEDLARSYIAFGFGLEARDLLELDGRSSAIRDHLRRLAMIVDGVPLSAANARAFADCMGPATLWHALASGSMEEMTEAERTSATTSWRLLPNALRGQLAPRLAAILAQTGDSLAAGELLGRAVGTDGMQTTEASLAIASAALAGGDTAAALDQLQTVANEDRGITPEALIEMVDLAIAEGRPLDRSALTQLRALRFEFRDRRESVPLALAEARLLSSTGDHAGSLALIMGQPSVDRGSALDSALLALASDPNDALFLETALAIGPVAPGHAAGNAMAARLIRTGFPDAALPYLRGTSAGAEMSERRYLRAEAAVLMGRTDLVEAELIGMTDARAESIRAAVALTTAGSDTLAWRLGDWDALALSSDPLMQAVSALQIEALRSGADTAPEDAPQPAAEQTDLADGLPPLAARSELIAEAQATRAMATELLGRFASP